MSCVQAQVWDYVSAMRITPAIFDAFLKCATKCHLRSLGEVGLGNEYAEWVRGRDESYQREAARRLQETVPEAERVAAPPATENIKVAKWRLAVDLVAQTPDKSVDNHVHELEGSGSETSGFGGPRSEQLLESRLHAVERAPSEGRGKPAQFVPIRFVFRNKLTKDDRLLLAFDALVLSQVLGHQVSLGKIIHGDDHATLKVKTSALTGEVRKRIEKTVALLSNPAPPDLVLNRHCAECEFQARCRKIAVEKDDLSLLANMSAKERQELRSKGIFSVTQLSYTFRPRRRPKKLRDKREKYHHSLKALAIREKKIHIVGSPELKIEGTPVYLDVEGLPDRDFYYLIGVRIGNGESAVQHSLWAETVADEGKIWREFLAILKTIEKPVLIHYGSYETTFLKEMWDRHCGPPKESPAAKVISSAVNLVSLIYGRIYFPTFSNGLKEIARSLGFEWSEASASGVQAVQWRETWSSRREQSEQQKLISYNSDDYAALDVVTRGVLGLHPTCSGSRGTGERDVVDTTALKREHPYGFKRNKFFFPELDAINKAAYWDYQREKVYVKSNRRLRHALKANARSKKTLPPNKHIQCSPPTGCPLCGSQSIRKHGQAKKIVHDLKFTPTGVKRWIVHYHFHCYVCQICGRVFHRQTHDWSGSKFGPAMLAYSVYQNIELRLPQETIDRSLNKLFGLRLARGTACGFKTKAAQMYAVTYESLLRKLPSGDLLHADETKVSVGGKEGFVWVFASLDEVAYVYTESREGDWVQTFLKDFKGVLVSDFYAGYDAIECPKQRCLIHLLRDLNDDLHKHPYDEDLKQIGKAFADLVTPMIETVDRYGLKARFLKKHLSSVCRFYRELSRMNFGSEVSEKCK
jgi:predicted RecB family nuclease